MRRATGPQRPELTPELTWPRFRAGWRPPSRGQRRARPRRPRRPRAGGRGSRRARRRRSADIRTRPRPPRKRLVFRGAKNLRSAGIEALGDPGAFAFGADPGETPPASPPFGVNPLSVLKLGRFPELMSLDMLVNVRSKCKIRVPSCEGPIKGVMGPSAELGPRAPRPRASRTWAARGAPTAAATAAPPHPVLVPSACAGCGVGVPQGRRGLNGTCSRRRRHLPRASGGASRGVTGASTRAPSWAGLIEATPAAPSGPPARHVAATAPRIFDQAPTSP